MPQQPPPTTPVQIIPWLAQPLSPWVWGALGVSLLVAAWAISRFRRSAEPCPVSARWLAVGVVVAVGFFAALSFGGQLANAVTVYAAPVFVLASALVAFVGWHTDETSRGGLVHVGVLPLALASLLGSGCVLACLWLLWLPLKAKDARLDLDLGLGLGEAVSQLLPALGSVVLPLMLLPAGHPRAAGARRAVVTFGGLLLLILAGTAAAGTAAMTTPLPYESPLSDRYVYLNTLVAVPAVLAGACVLGAWLAGWSASFMGRIMLAVVTGVAAFVAAKAVGGGPTLKTVFGFDWWRPAACLCGGLLVGLVLAGTRWPALVKAVLGVIGIGICGVLGERLMPGGSAGNEFLSLVAKCAALMGLFTVCALTPVARPPWEPAESKKAREPVAVVLMTGCVLMPMLLLFAVTLRSDLTYQARRFSASFDYETNRQVDPDMRRLLQNSQHGLNMASDRWAWVVPQATWWTRDGAWRDALLVADRAQARGDEPARPGFLYGGVITGEDRKQSDESFTNARHVALVQPVPRGQKRVIIHAVAARQATAAQVWSWARLHAGNVGVWLAALLGLPLAWWLTRTGRKTLSALIAGAAALLAVACFGVGSAFVLLGVTGLLVVLTSARREDAWRSATAVLMLGGVAAAMMALLIPVSELFI